MQFDIAMANAPQATITVGEKAISRLTDGIGVNWCDAFGMGGERGYGQLNVALNTPVIPLLDDLENWTLLIDEMTALKIGCVRFMLPPDGFITRRGTMDFESVHFHRLERLNAWASANGATIVLDTMYVPRHLQARGDDGEGWADHNRSAADPTAFAESFAGPLLDYCLSERGWNQIRYYSPVNEPIYGGIYHHPRGDVYRAYAGLMASLRKELIERDIVPQRVSLLAPGSPSITEWPIPEFHARGLDLDPLVDAYDQHAYFARFDNDPPNANAPTVQMQDLVSRHLSNHVEYARKKGKPFLITELGSTYYGAHRGDPNGPATHDAFVLDAELAIRAINAGVSGLMRWSFLNPGDIDGNWALLRLEEGTYRRNENTFYGYATLIRYARPHSDVMDVSVESSLYPWPHVHACALRKTPQGDVTLLVVNDHDSEQIDLSVKLPAIFRTRKLNVIRCDRLQKHVKISEIKKDARSTPFSDKIPPRSLSVYTSLEHDPLTR
jgi:hypothetical protein